MKLGLVIANEHLSLHGHDLKIDHRTFLAQGIDLEPQHKIGASIARQRLARFEDHQRIAHENGQKILENPQIAINAITCQQSTFTSSDLKVKTSAFQAGSFQLAVVLFYRGYGILEQVRILSTKMIEEYLEHHHETKEHPNFEIEN